MKLQDLIPVIVVVVFVVLPAIARLLFKVREAAKPPGPPGQRPAADKSVFEEIQDFLRKANEAARQQQQQGRRPEASKRRPTAQPTPPRQPQRPVMAEAVDQNEEPTGAEVSQHVKKYLETSDFDRRRKQLGAEISQADEKLEKRLHGVFDHQVGRLSDTAATTTAGPEVSSTAAGIFAMLVRPEGLRQAILLNEILQRPVDRWS